MTLSAARVWHSTPALSVTWHPRGSHWQRNHLWATEHVLCLRFNLFLSTSTDHQPPATLPPHLSSIHLCLFILQMVSWLQSHCFLPGVCQKPLLEGNRQLPCPHLVPVQCTLSAPRKILLETDYVLSSSAKPSRGSPAFQGRTRPSIQGPEDLAPSELLSSFSYQLHGFYSTFWPEFAVPRWISVIYHLSPARIPRILAFSLDLSAEATLWRSTFGPSRHSFVLLCFSYHGIPVLYSIVHVSQ